MKRINLACVMLFCITTFAQQGINYKALIKDGGGNIVANQSITVQFQILQGVGMTNVYQETHMPNTDANGITMVNIGKGTTTDVFTDIDWGSDDHYLNVQIDTGGGLTNMGTTQFMAVPYALSAANAASKIDELSDGKSDTDGSSIFLGVNSGFNDDGTNNKNIGLGFQTLLLNSTGSSNIANGYQVLFNNTTGNHNTAIGNQALVLNTAGNENTANGSLVLFSNTTGSSNTANGFSGLWSNTTGSSNTANGYQAGYNNSTGNGNVFMGYKSGYNELGSNTLYIENSNADADNALIYGEFDNNILRTNSEFQIGNPTGTGFAFPSVDGTSNQVLQTDGSGALNWGSGSSLGLKINDLTDGKSDDDGSQDGSSVFLGADAGLNDDSTDNINVGIGFHVLRFNTSGNSNTAIGYKALGLNKEGNHNTANGLYALYFNETGNNNTANGSIALSNNSTGFNNTANGFGALLSNSTGSNNTAIGKEAGYNSVGNSNIFLGYRSGFDETGSNILYVENSNADADNALIYGEFGLDNTSNNNVLRTNSEFQIGNPIGTGFAFPSVDGTNNQVLQTDGSGALSWVNGSSLGAQQINDLTDGKSDNDGTENGSSVFIGVNAGLNDDGSNNQNVAVGFEALKENTTGSFNVANGYAALFYNITGSFNVANGYAALFNNITGTANTATGYEALYDNTTEDFNTATGYKSLYSNKTGSDNTANGSLALTRNTDGDRNTANGRSSLFHNITGSDNTANGSFALYVNSTGINNTANGSFALTLNTTGSNNTANGYQALYSNTTGYHNTANGKGSLYLNTFGYKNTANGFEALYNNTSGQRNSANGAEGLYSNIDGDHNTANGYAALKNSTSGNGNTANGYNALTANTTGSNNTANGWEALSLNTTGSNNTAIGNNAQVPNATANNQVRIGNTAVTSATTQVAWTFPSDIRWKENIRDLPYGLEVVKQLKPVDYMRKNNGAKTRDMGFIAQDVEALLVKIGYTDQGFLTKDDKGLMSLRYNDFIALLTKAVQEQQKIINDQTSRAQELEAKLSENEARMDKIEALLKIN